MRDCYSTALKVVDNRLWVLDQQALPLQEIWVESTSVAAMITIIQQLKVRGAPLIGIAAGLALAQFAESNPSVAAITAAAAELKAARPTAVNLAYCIDRIMARYHADNDRNAISDEAVNLFVEDGRLCDEIAQHGAPLINSNENILTICNTGSLVTTGVGTALGMIHHAHRQHKAPHVWACETRPLLQGARLTAWECVQAGISHHIICDGMAAGLMGAGKVDKILVGADRIARNGDTANKIGTYSLAVLAHYHHIPFYVVAPYTTIDRACNSGSDIVIEQRSADEVRGARCGELALCWSPAASAVYNPAFDVTPANLITGIVLNSGVYAPAEIAAC